MMSEPVSPTPLDARLLALLDRWQALREQGQAVTPAELCADCPELVGALERLLRGAAPPAGLDPPAVSTVPPSAQTIGPVPSLPPPDPLATPTIPRYQVEEVIGRGGMGAVYRASDRLLHRRVALKVIRPEVFNHHLRERFFAEARAVARLSHPHIVTLFDVGEWQPPGGGATMPFVALEYVPGGSLSQRVGLEPLPPAEAARLVRLLARAMHHAHAQGIVHRDLKLDNILLAPPGDEPGMNTALGCPKVTDFGLAREVSGEQRLSTTGAVMGTPTYMAPEQAEGRADVGPPADVYALGVILYRLLTGRLPFTDPSVVNLLYKVCHEAPPPLRQLRPELPPELERICLACLTKAPEQRPTAAALADQLGAFLAAASTETTLLATPPAAPKRRRSRRPWLLAALAAMVLLAGAGLWWATRDRQPGAPTSSPEDTPAAVAAPEAAPPAPAAPVQVRSLQVVHYVADGGDLVPRGLIGDRSFAARVGDAVTLTVELSAPGYLYLVGYNFDGREQLLWPVDGDGRPSAAVAPPRLDRLRYPVGQGQLKLDDATEGGLQAYLVAASSRPLPPFAQWRRDRDDPDWEPLPAGKMVWVADPAGVYPVVPGLGPERGQRSRGSLRPAAGVPPLSRLCRSFLRGGVEAVEAVAFPVEGKEPAP